MFIFFQAFKNMLIVPPGSGIVHQVNLEYLARVCFNDNGKKELVSGWLVSNISETFQGINCMVSLVYSQSTSVLCKVSQLVQCTVSHLVYLCTISHLLYQCTVSHPLYQCTVSHLVFQCTGSHLVFQCTVSHLVYQCTASHLVYSQANTVLVNSY